MLHQAIGGKEKEAGCAVLTIYLKCPDEVRSLLQSNRCQHNDYTK